MVGCFVALSNTNTIKKITRAIKQCPNGADMLVVEDMNIEIDDPKVNERDDTIAASQATSGMEDISEKLLPRKSIQ